MANPVNFKKYIIIATYTGIFLMAIDGFTDEKHHNQTKKAAINISMSSPQFKQFIKEREYFDDPYELSTKESEELLSAMHKIILNDNNRNKFSDGHETMAKDFIESLKKGHGEYLKVSNRIYIVYSYSNGVWLFDLNLKKRKLLASGYAIEITNKGYLSNGTGWILCQYYGSNGIDGGGNYLVTYIVTEKGASVTVYPDHKVSNGNIVPITPNKE